MKRMENSPTVIVLRPEDSQGIIAGLAANPQAMAAVADQLSSTPTAGDSQAQAPLESREPRTLGKSAYKGRESPLDSPQAPFSSLH